MHPLSSTIFFAQASSTKALKANDLLFSICTQDRGNVQTFAIYKFAFPKKKIMPVFQWQTQKKTLLTEFKTTLD